MAIDPKKQAELNKLKAEYKKIVSETNAESEEAVALFEKMVALQNDLTTSAEAHYEQAQKTLADQNKNLEIMKEIADLNGDQEGIQDILIAQGQAKVDLAEKELAMYVEALNTRTDMSKEEKAFAALIIKEKEKELELEQAALDLKNQQTEAYNSIEGSVGSTVSGLLGSIDASKTFAGQLFLAAGHSGGIAGVVKNIGKGLSTALKPANVMAGLFAKVQEGSFKAFLSVDAFRADLAKAGASLDQYGGMMKQVSDDTVAAGVALKDTQQAILGLHSGMAGFNTMAKADQQTLVATTAVMSKLGVDAATSAGNLNILTKSMGMNAKEANIATKEIAATAQALGVSQAQMASDFAAAAPQLSAHGAAGVQVFRKLATQAKATGVAMGTLLSIAGQFDTFEGAAEAAGKLNAVLGTQINSIDLLTATEDERIKMLRDSVDASGKSWESMNKFEKQMVASAAGISDVNEAGKLFGTTAREMENAATAAEKMALADKELQEQAANASTASEKLALIAERFGVVMIPLIDSVHWFLDGILKLNSAMGGLFLPILFGVVGAVFLLVKATQMYTATMTALQTIAKATWFIKMKNWLMTKLNKKATEELADAQEKQADSQDKVNKTSTGGGFLKWLKEFGKILTKNWKGFLAFGGAMMMIGAGIAIAALGLAQFVLAFAGMDPLQILAVSVALLVFLGAMIALAKVMLTVGAAAAIPMLAFGAAFVLIGLGVAIAALGMAKFVEAFRGLDPSQIMGVVTGLAMFGVIMISLATTMALLGSVAIGPLLAFGAAFLLIGAGVALASMGMANLANPLIRLSEVGGGLAEAAGAIGLLSAGIYGLAAALMLIKTDDLRAIADMAMGMGTISVESAVAFGDAMVDTREAVVAMAQEPVAATMLAATTTAFAAKQVVGGTGATGPAGAPGAGAGASGDRTIILKLDKRELGRAVINIFEKEQNLNRVK